MNYQEKVIALLNSKELSNEQKEKLENIFPELKKSEDDRIREDLIQWIDDFPDSIWRGHYKKDILAWLEKQEKKEYALKSFRDKDVHKFMQYIEKQAKAYEFNLPNRGYDIYAFAKDILIWIENQQENKPIDKVEPKFHEGDWITNGQLTCKVLSVTGKFYELHLYNDDYCHFETDVQSVDKCYRLWTIQDAKDGDVLVTGEMVFIFNKIHGEWVNCHCSLHIDNSLCTEDYDLLTAKYAQEIFPATKEQRDLLFRKMKEAGYEWRQDEKKIIKINGPKFKVRDWLIDNEDGVIFQIVKVLDNTYTYKTNEGKEYSCTHYSLENDTKLWTIQEAKNGDVLATENFIFIFKNIDDGNGVHYYCQYEIIKHEDDNQFDIALPQSLMGRVGNSISHYSPATKEQRELLFKKMKEAGYEWDDENKKLNKP